MIKTVKLLPKQINVLKTLDDNNIKEVLLSGSYGSSKTFVLCYVALKQATIPGNTVLICRKTLTSLKKSTLEVLIGGDNPVIPKGAYKYLKQEQKIEIYGGGQIYLQGLDDMMKVRSMNLGCICVDEATELDEEDWLELKGRLRLEYGSRQIYGATNPGSPSHFLYKRFIEQPADNVKMVKMITTDNIYLPKDYIDDLDKLPSGLRDRFFLGEWLALEGLVYPQFDRNKHIKQTSYGEFYKYMVGVDFGFTAPCAIGLFGIKNDNSIHMIEEIKQNGLLVSEIVKKVLKYAKYKPECIVDPSAPALIAELLQRGIDAKGANNDIITGVSRMQNMLHQNKLTISEDCHEFIKEIENYIYDKSGDKPIKKDDHIMDMVRYVVNQVEDDKNKTKPFALCYEDYIEQNLNNNDDDDDDDDTNEYQLMYNEAGVLDKLYKLNV